jgi:epoxyqueuosine reductase
VVATALAAPTRRDRGDARLTEAARAAGLGAGLVAVGVTTAAPFDSTRALLEDRRERGLSASMQFTYRNPARSTDPARLMPSARSIVAGAWPTDAGPAAVEAGSGRVGRYAWRDNYAELRAALTAVADVLRAAGHDARVVSDDNALVDRAVAQRAGLGWFGKNANVLVPGHGSWVVLGAVVTTAALVANDAPVDDGCGSCARCIDCCPTGAIVAPGVVDARRCLAWLVQARGSFPVEFRAALGDRIYGCDDCQEVCPPSRAAASKPEHAASSSAAATAASVDLRALLRASDAELMAAHHRWYIADRDPRYLRRNALIALANSADIADHDVLALIDSYAAGDDALLAEHARWAGARLRERRRSS